MKDLVFRVELSFADDVSDDKDVMEIAQRVAQAIVDGANGRGIAPENGDTYLEIVRVTPNYLNKTIIEHIN